MLRFKKWLALVCTTCTIPPLAIFQILAWSSISSVFKHVRLAQKFVTKKSSRKSRRPIYAHSSRIFCSCFCIQPHPFKTCDVGAEKRFSFTKTARVRQCTPHALSKHQSHFFASNLTRFWKTDDIGLMLRFKKWLALVCLFLHFNYNRSTIAEGNVRSFRNM